MAFVAWEDGEAKCSPDEMATSLTSRGSAPTPTIQRNFAQNCKIFCPSPIQYPFPPFFKISAAQVLNLPHRAKTVKTVKVKSWKVKQGRLSVRGASQSANCQEGKLSDIDKTLLRNLSLE